MGAGSFEGEVGEKTRHSRDTTPRQARAKGQDISAEDADILGQFYDTDTAAELPNGLELIAL